MIVRVHVEHLVVDGGSLHRADGDAVAAALTSELERLLAADPTAVVAGSDGSSGPDARPSERAAAALDATDWSTPASLGAAAARLVHAEVVGS